MFRAADADEVRRALAASNVAAVGPVVAATLGAYGVRVETMPESAWFMKPLTAALTAALAGGASGPGAEKDPREDTHSPGG